ncbi:hypothetical protein [Desulfurobacterium indicum]|uniref:O-antigen polymerase n=1 Tax=Desulfurobacterium indicum TaxID=1914305 RepID=A0A1R1MLS0_9BACT|nr:hypothetical protein [Desulfurobacterium indicum]OMH40758.1 hypothetical protein BLW93_03530 [Desulfurobacterium indicum]
MNFVDKFRWIEVLFLLSVSFVAGLPSGYVFSIPVKLFFSFSIFGIFLYISSNKEVYFSNNFIILSLAFLWFLLVYLLIGYLRFGVYSLKECELILITFVLYSMVYLLLSNVFGMRFFITLVEISITVVFLVKLAALLYVYKHPGVDSMIEFFIKYFNTKVVTMKFLFGLYRINFPADILPAFFPWILAWYLRNKLYSMNKIDFIVLFFSIFIVLLGFSRYLILVFTLGLIYLLKVSGINWKIFGIIFLAFFVVFRKFIVDFIKLRFFSGAVKASDAIRFKQTPALVKLFLKKPLIGYGIGAFSFEYVRSRSMCFSYEEQILTFFVKFGTLGMFFLLTVVLFIFAIFISRKDYTAVSIFFLFIVAGWFNPYLYSSSVFLIYVFIALMVNNENFHVGEIHAV